jgi:hypothetical protein
VVFTESVFDLDTSAYTLTHAGSSPLNIVVFRSNPLDVAAHEFGHVFGLSHFGFISTNLMCGQPQEFAQSTIYALLTDPLKIGSCTPDSSVELTNQQLLRAKDVAKGLQEPSN